MTHVCADGQDLVGFYLREVGGPRGHTFGQILQLSDQELERRHDVIQWIFPTLRRSEAVPEAPFLTTQDAIELRANPLTRQRAVAALVRMLAFYGLELDDDPEEPTIDLAAERFLRRKPFWLSPGNHNYRRITRILTSLQILGCPQHAMALFECLTFCYRKHGGLIGAAPMEHWRRAVGTTRSVSQQPEK